MGDQRTSGRNEGYGTLSASNKQADTQRDFRHRDRYLGKAPDGILERMAAKLLIEWLAKMRNAYKLQGD